MPDKIDLGDGEYAEIRTELTGGDQKWYLILRDKLRRENGTAKPATSGPDPANSAVMLEVPAVPAELLVEDNITLLDAVLGRLLTSSSRFALPWTPGMRDETDLDIVTALDEKGLEASNRLVGGGPKRNQSTPTSAPTSSTDASAPQPEQTPEP